MLSGLKDIYESLAMMARLQLDEPFLPRHLVRDLHAAGKIPSRSQSASLVRGQTS